MENLPAWTQEEAEGKLEGILAEMMDYAYENGLMAETVLYTKICLIQNYGMSGTGTKQCPQDVP